MIYTLLSSNAADVELATIWLQAPDKAEVSIAANRIDTLLRHSSDARGNDRPGTFELEIPPLPASFSVSPDDCKVVILGYCRIPS